MKRVLIAITVVLIALLSGVWHTVFYTDYGVNAVLSRLTQLKNMRIEIAGASGSFGGTLFVKHFELDHKYAHITADDIELSITPRALFAQTLRVTTLRIGKTTVTTKAVNEPPTDTPPRFFTPLLLLQADAVDIRNARFVHYDGTTQFAHRVRARARLTADRMQIDRATVEADQFTAGGYMALRARRPIPLEADIAFRLPAKFGADLEGKVAASGHIEHINIDAVLSEPSTAQFKSEFTRGAGRWQLTGTLLTQRFSLASWLEAPPFSLNESALDVELDSRNGVMDARIVGTAVVPEVDVEPLQLDVAAQYAARVLALTRGAVKLEKSDTAVSIAGRIAFDDSTTSSASGNDTPNRPQINATAQWQHFRWPLRGDTPAFVSREGQVSISGAWPYAIGVQAEGLVRNDIPVQLSAHGEISEHELRADRFEMKILDGQASGNGTLNFKQRAWKATVKANDINFAPLSAQLNSRIAVDATGSGAGFGKDGQFTLNVPTLRGELRNQPITARGAIQRDNKNWIVREAVVTLGDASLNVTGTYADKIDLRWSLHAPALENFLADARGSLHSDGFIRGTYATPHIEATLRGEQLKYGEWQLASVTARANTHLAGNDDSQLHVTLRELKNGKVSLGSPQLIANMAQQRLSRYAFDRREQWRIDRFCIDWPEMRDSDLNAERRVCGDASWSRNGTWSLQAQSGELPLSMFDGSIPEKARYTGLWQARVNAQSSPTKPLNGEAVIRFVDAALIHQPVEGEEETMQLGTGQLHVLADATAFTANARLATPGTTRIEGNARIERLPNVELSNSPLTGRLVAHTGDANLLPLIFPDIDHSNGELDADLSVRGSVALPELSGRIQLARGELALYRYNLSLRDMALTAEFVDNSLKFDGQALAGEGQMRIRGELAWRDLKPYGNLHFSGDRLTIADLPEYRILASPDVRFAISGTRIDITGEVFIPTARLQPADLSGATQLSPDARLTSAPPGRQSSGFDIYSEVRVRIGDDVLIDTLGLQGKLAGTVTTVVQPAESALGRGELSVSNGRYEAYGQKLEIIRGRLLFNATPLDDPGLDIQAARDIEEEEQRVGVNVRGTLRAPRISLFADPSLPSPQIVSYLLTGKPLDDLKAGDTSSVGLATDTLALQGGGVLASQLGRRIGIEEVGIESRGVNDTSLVLGKFLSPRFFVSYGISLTESINTFKMRYTISDKWRFKSEIGQNQSADLEFRIER